MWSRKIYYRNRMVVKMADAANTESGWYWVRSAEQEFPVYRRPDGNWQLSDDGMILSTAPMPVWTVGPRIGDLLRDAVRYRHARDDIISGGLDFFESVEGLSREEFDALMDARIAGDLLTDG